MAHRGPDSDSGSDSDSGYGADGGSHAYVQSSDERGLEHLVLPLEERDAGLELVLVG